jgi:uncharacterized protein YpmB
MTEIYIVAVLFVVIIGAFIFYRITRSKNNWEARRKQSLKIEEKRIRKEEKASLYNVLPK